MTPSPDKAAPEPLDTIRQFLNTGPRPGSQEAFIETGSLRSWLVERSLMPPGPPFGLDEVERVLGLREALRGVVPVGRKTSISGDALTAVNHLAARSPLVARIDKEGTAQLHPAGDGVDAAMAQVVAIVYSSIVTGSWRRLKLCANAQCRTAFYDKSKNGVGNWCSTTDCGNPANARAYRKRKRAGS